MKLQDFQIVYEGTDELAVNHSVFATFEPIRLWLYDRKRAERIDAPFRKIVIMLSQSSTDATNDAAWNVYAALSICHVECRLDRQAAVKEQSWVRAMVSQALGHIRDSTGWWSADLAQFVADLEKQKIAPRHYFRRLETVDRRSGARCVPWISFSVDETKIGLQIGSHDIVVRAQRTPIYLEDDFSLAKTAIRDGAFLFMDAAGAILATVPLGDLAGPHG